MRGSQSGLLALFAVAEGIRIARQIAEYQNETDAELACMREKHGGLAAADRPVGGKAPIAPLHDLSPSPRVPVGQDRLRNLAWIPALVAAAVICVSLYGNRARYSRADFRQYYSWWSEFRAGVDPWLPEASPEQVTRGGIGFCDWTPAYVTFLSPFALLPQRAAYWLWQGLQLAALLASLVMLLREMRPRPHSTITVLAIALALLYPPVHATLHGAQTAFLLLLTLTASWLLARRSRPAAAGLTLALATVLKAFPGAVGGYFLFRRRFDVLGWAILFAVLSIIGTGVGHWREWILYGTPMTTGDFDQLRMVSVLSNVYHFLHQAFPAAGQGQLLLPAFSVTLLIDLLVLAFAGCVSRWMPDDNNSDGLYFGIWLGVALLLSPASWDHELPLLLPIYLFAGAGFLESRPSYRVAAGIMAAAVAVVALAAVVMPFRPLHPYFLATLSTVAAAGLALRPTAAQPIQTAPAR